MHPANCLNCGENISVAAHFCRNCGQKAQVHRLTFHEIIHDAIHAFTHTDKGFFHLLKALAFHPGVVAREYVSGKRKKYFNPFSFLVIITGVLVLASSNLNFFGTEVRRADNFDVSTMPEHKKEMMLGVQKRAANFVLFVNRHANLVLFVSTPFIALILWLLYKKRSFNYAEHLTSVVFFNSFLMIITALIFGPLIYFTRRSVPYPFWMVSMLSFHILYIAWAYRQMLNISGAKAVFSTLGKSVIAVLSWALFSTLMGMAYMFFG